MTTIGQGAVLRPRPWLSWSLAFKFILLFFGDLFFMSDYKRPIKMIAKIISPSVRSIKYVKSSPYGVLKYTKNINEALPLTRHEMSLVRYYVDGDYKISRLNPETFKPGTMTIDQILTSAKLPIQPDMF